MVPLLRNELILVPLLQATRPDTSLIQCKATGVRQVELWTGGLTVLPIHVYKVNIGTPSFIRNCKYCRVSVQQRVHPMLDKLSFYLSHPPSVLIIFLWVKNILGWYIEIYITCVFNRPFTYMLITILFQWNWMYNLQFNKHI